MISKSIVYSDESMIPNWEQIIIQYNPRKLMIVVTKYQYKVIITRKESTYK